uniref:Bromodomain and PHD finger-containing protein 3 n=1 Tax=Rhizophora mucronata TaxID=61149 RepID=A0A2P2JH09_RHIMU
MALVQQLMALIACKCCVCSHQVEIVSSSASWKHS